MSLLEISTAIEDRLAALWNKCPVRGLNAPNRSTSPAGEPYLQVEYPASLTRQISIGAPGANTYRTEGGFVLVLAVERGTGLKAWLAWTRELVGLFRSQTFDGLRCFEPAEPSIDGSNASGEWFELSVAVPYEFDFLA